MSMETITYSHVQDLVARLPITNLPLAYSFLFDLTTNEADSPSPQLDFMRFSLERATPNHGAPSPADDCTLRANRG